MRLVENPLRCYECRTQATTEEVEIFERDGKQFWICPKCEMEYPVIEKDYPKFKGK